MLSSSGAAAGKDIMKQGKNMQYYNHLVNDLISHSNNAASMGT